MKKNTKNSLGLQVKMQFGKIEKNGNELTISLFELIRDFYYFIIDISNPNVEILA
jgi:hypothetical protein